MSSSRTSSRRSGGTNSRNISSSISSSRNNHSRSQSPDYLTGDMPGLRRLVQKRLLEEVFDGASAKDPNWKVLVVDDASMKVVSAAVGMYDIMERKVTLVESLEKKRAPFPDMGVIYLLAPTADSVARCMADYDSSSNNSNNNKQKPLYGNSVFLYFLGRLHDRLLDQIKQCKPLLKRVKCLVEVNIDFLAVQERAFTLDMRDQFVQLYMKRSSSPAEAAMAEKLVTLCATLNEYPHIRFRQSSQMAKSLASVFHLKMDQFVSQNPTWWYHGGPSNNKTSSSSGAAKRERGVLLLMDRATDCLTPLMHDFTYQAMVRDLLPLKGNMITYQNETTNDPTQTTAKDVLLDERDKLWVELRSQHIAQVIETLSNRIREIMNSSTGSSLGKKGGAAGAGNMSLSQMAAALKALPEYKEVMSKLSQHMHISHECMDIFRNQRLLDLSELEQTLATGKDEQGRTPKFADTMNRVEDEMMRIKSKEGRLRLILITTISQGGLASEDRKRLMSAAALRRDDLRILNALELLGLSVYGGAGSSKKGGMFGGGRLQASAQSDDESEYAASRFVPALKTALTEMAQDALSFDDYPSVLPMPENTGRAGGGSGGGSSKSSRSGRRGEATSARKKGGASSKWAKSGSGGGDKSGAGPIRYVGGRHIVFMIGGLSYTELRAVEEVSRKESREIIIGSTAFVTPAEYMEDLTELGKDED